MEFGLKRFLLRLLQLSCVHTIESGSVGVNSLSVCFRSTDGELKAAAVNQ